MDIVITTVNGLDPLWQQDYTRYVGKCVLAKRYRDWGTLPYLMRGIERCMPFVENVFLVVSRESQVPAWVNRTEVKVVLHEDFMPAEALPTFNSTTIEMFLHRIPGLAEEFVYFNDDFFPLQDCQPEDFFRDGKLAVSMAHHLLTLGNLFRIHTKRSYRLARHAAGLGDSILYLRPQHTCQPMLRSSQEELFEKCKEEILQSVSPLRTKRNYNQYLYTDYSHLNGLTFPYRISNHHLSLSIASLKKIRQTILHPRGKMACINDVEMSDQKYEKYRQGILDAFAERFPQKSKYEN